MARGVAEPPRETVDALTLDDAVLHEAHRAGGEVVVKIPVGGAGDRVGLAALAGAQPGVVRRRCGAEEAHIAWLRGESRAAGTAVDAGGRDARDELAVEARVAGRERSVLLVEGQVHLLTLASAADNDQRETDIVVQRYPRSMTMEAGSQQVSLDALQAELGDVMRTDPESLNRARADKSGHLAARPPLAVVEATSIEQIQATLRYATAHRIPVVPRGAGTGLAGGAIGGAGEMVLSTERMNRVLEVSIDDELAVVEPGVINGDLNAMLTERGLWYAPDPASRAISTIGGNIATNAGGLLCAKYGVTREAVLGLKVVLPDGRLISTGHRTVKGVTGYDLTALMVGSEGTLGVIAEATLKLRPLPRGGVSTLSASFASVDDAARAAAVIVASGIKPAIMELLDASALESIGAYLDLDLGGRGAQLLVQTDGMDFESEATDAAAVMRSLGGEVELTTDRDEGERLFAIRRSFHPSLEAKGTVLIEDVAVPRSALPAMFESIQRIERTYGIEIPTVAHAGDGNLHPNFVFAAAQTADGHVEVPDHVWAAADELFLDCLRLGGTLTGEHGVGLLKRRWLRDELGDDSYELQRQIKKVFDPQGILNPGKVFGE